MKPNSLWVGCLFVVAACGDAQTPYIQPLTVCERYCLDLESRLEAEAIAHLEGQADDADCSTPAAANTACVASCENAAAPQACLDCRVASSSGCHDECMGASLTQSVVKITEAMACWVGQNQPSAMCADNTTTVVRGRLDDPLLKFEIDYTGTASIASLNPLSFVLPDGRKVPIEAPASIPGAAVDDVVMLDVESTCPWWCESAYVVRSSSGVLLQAGWSGRMPLPISEFDLNFSSASCVGTERTFVSAIDLALLVDGAEVLVGSSLDKRGYRLHNGASFDAYLIWGADVPTIWYEGLIEAL